MRFALALPLALFGADAIADEIGAVLALAGAVLLVLCIVSIVATRYRKRVQAALFGEDIKGTLNEVGERLVLALRKTAEGDEQGIRDHVGYVTREVAAVYSWVTLRRLMLATVGAACAAFLGLVGSYLVIRQTEDDSNDQTIRWMNVTRYLKGRKDKKSSQIIFDGENLDMNAVWKVRDEFFPRDSQKRKDWAAISPVRGRRGKSWAF